MYGTDKENVPELHLCRQEIEAGVDLLKVDVPGRVVI